MEIFKLFEATIAEIQPGHINVKDLRRDELLDNYDEATKTLQTLIKAKENEITYRRNLVDMLEKSRVIYDNKLIRAKQAYQNAKKHAPESLDLKGSSKKIDLIVTSSLISSSASSSSIKPSIIATLTNTTPTQPNVVANPIANAANLQTSLFNDSGLDIPLPGESTENRSSLDRRLSEFLKTFPNLSQAGLAPPSNNNDIKTLPGYYTQQPPPPPIFATPPLMAMMRFPPPPIVPPGIHQPSNPGGSSSSGGTSNKHGSDKNKYTSSSSSSSHSSNRSKRR